jgi:hypothetical protein
MTAHFTFPSTRSVGGQPLTLDGTMRQQLIAELDAARGQLNETLDLLNRALDLREQLWFGINLDDMAEAVAELRQATEAHKRARRVA